ncbi:MAG: CsbD family protein [Thiobacillaceae bacterium]
MSWDIVEGNGRQSKGKLTAQWGALADNHLDAMAGRLAKRGGTLQEAYDTAKDEAEQQIQRFDELNKDAPPKDPS